MDMMPVASQYVLHTTRRELPREWDEQMAKVKQRDQPCCDDDSDEEDGDEDEVEDDYLVMMMMKSYRL